MQYQPYNTQTLIMLEMNLYLQYHLSNKILGNGSDFKYGTKNQFGS